MNQTDSRPRPGPRIIPRSEHGISRANISENALKVLYRLRKSGYMAFLVGGGVRDLLLGLEPKDFDIVTDAHPEEIRKLFRNSRLIGRRFRLAHVRFGRDIVEVATFRAERTAEDDDRSHDEGGRILRDNVYGTIDEDIWRRDFTVNALYYNIADYTVWDYIGGMDDLESRTLRLIDDPWTRYREDPVRMLRAVRFAAKLGFAIANETAVPIRDLGHLLRDVPPARLFEEVLKLFLGGHAVRSFELLVDRGLLQYLFPATSELLARPDAANVRAFIRQGLASTDARVAEDKSISPMFVYGVFLWPPVSRLSRILQQEGMTEYAATQEALNRLMLEQISRTALPKRFGMPMKEMLMMQRRFRHRRGQRATRLLEHKRFRAAYDFLLLRAEARDVDPEIAEWWMAIQKRSPEQQKAELGKGRKRRSGRGRRGRSRARSSDAVSQ